MITLTRRNFIDIPNELRKLKDFYEDTYFLKEKISSEFIQTTLYRLEIYKKVKNENT